MPPQPLKVAYLSSQVTQPGSPIRRSDAFEHDYMMEALQPAFSDIGLTLSDVPWDADTNWTQFDAAIIGTTWDYWDRAEKYLAALTGIAQQTQLHNPVELVRWNIDKRYLRELEAKGAVTIPTLWFDAVSPEDVAAAFSTFECDDLVIKRQIGAGASGQVRLRAGDPVPSLRHPMMVQPFQPSIERDGELSFIFIDGEFSHALVKTAADGDYRIQSSYGGTEAVLNPSREDIASARAVVHLLNDVPLYARVDMLRTSQDTLALMELELIEPYLYPQQGPDLGPMLAGATRQRLASSR